MCLVSSWCYQCGCPCAFKPHDNPIQRCQKWLNSEPGSKSPPCKTKYHFDYLPSCCKTGCGWPFLDDVGKPKCGLGGDGQADGSDADVESLGEDRAGDGDSGIDMGFGEKQTGGQKKR